MRILRKSSAFSKLADEEEPLRLLQHDNSASELGMGGSRDRVNEDDTDEKYTAGEDNRPRPRHDRYQRIGQLPAGFMSISALARDSGHQETVATAEDEAHELDEQPVHSQADEFRSDLKRRLYLLMEQPSSGSAAFWTNVIVSVLIVSSAVMTTIETIPAFRSAESNRVWFNLESAMVALFSLEYLLRVFAHSDSLRMLLGFFISPLSIIDFIAIIPFYIELIARRDTTYEFRFTILRLFRLLRLFKSYKYTNAIIMTIEVMVVALRRSSDALSALFFFLVTCVVLLATLLYFAERGVWDENLQTFVDPDGNPSSFDSIPAAFWFVMVTITTTGYGDMVPTTFIGKVVTFPAMLFGVLLIALPSIIIGRNFTIVWEAMRRRQYYNQLLESEGMMPDEVPMTTQHENFQHNHEGNTPSSFQAGSQTAQQAALGNPMSPLTTDPRRSSRSYDILQTGDEAILDQLQTLMVMTRQNQEAIQHILGILAKQGSSSERLTEGLEMDLGRQNHEEGTERAGNSTAKGKEVPRRGRSQSGGS